MALDIGRVAFEAYVKSVGGKTYDGKDIPKWENLNKTIRDGWRAAGVAAIRYIDKERTLLAKNGVSEEKLRHAPLSNEIETTLLNFTETPTVEVKCACGSIGIDEPCSYNDELGIPGENCTCCDGCRNVCYQDV